MSILDRLFGRGGAKAEAPTDRYARYYYIRCDKCGEVIRLRVDQRADFEQQFDERGGDEVAGYRVHKEVMGRGTCFKLMTVEIKFDRGYREVEKSVRGGAFVTKQEYDEAQAKEAGA